MASDAEVIDDFCIGPVQDLLDTIDDLRGDVIPVEGLTDGDAHIECANGGILHALDPTERVDHLVGVKLETLCERVAQAMCCEALGDVEGACLGVVRELVDEDTILGQYTTLF